MYNPKGLMYNPKRSHVQSKTEQCTIQKGFAYNPKGVTLVQKGHMCKKGTLPKKVVCIMQYKETMKCIKSMNNCNVVTHSEIYIYCISPHDTHYPQNF